MISHKAIYNTHSTVVSISGDGKTAFDLDNKPVILDQALVDAEVERLQTEFDAQEYARNREVAYPEVAEQLDLLWHAIDSGTLDNKDYRNVFYSTLKKVKNDNPKG